MKLFVYITLSILLLFSCKGKEGYVIEGKLTNLQSSSLYFVTPVQDGSGMHVDTIKCNQAGRFSYRGISDKLSPIIIYMENGSIWTTVWAQDKDKIMISGDVHYPELIIARGGDVNNLLAEFKNQNKELLKEKRDLTDKHSSNIERTDSLNSDSNQAEYKSKLSNIEHQLREKAEGFISQHSSSIASLILIQDYLMDVANPQLIQEYLSKIQGKATESPLYNKLVDVNNRIQRTTTGLEAPNFSVLDINNDTIHLSEFNGKYFLLIFAASWCEMCEKDNENLANLRKKIGPNQLGMLTISLDEDSIAWTNIVKKQQLSWHHVVDTHGWSSEMVSLYNITEIPSNILIDRESIIIGKNLTTDSIVSIIDKNVK